MLINTVPGRQSHSGRPAGRGDPRSLGALAAGKRPFETGFPKLGGEKTNVHVGSSDGRRWCRVDDAACGSGNRHGSKNPIRKREIRAENQIHPDDQLAEHDVLGGIEKIGALRARSCVVEVKHLTINRQGADDFEQVFVEFGPSSGPVGSGSEGRDSSPQYRFGQLAKRSQHRGKRALAIGRDQAP